MKQKIIQKLTDLEKQLSYYKELADILPDLVKDTTPLSNFFYKIIMER